MWPFFDAHPTVFVICFALSLVAALGVLGLVVGVLKLLIRHAKWFRLGLTGLEASRDGAPIEIPPGRLERLWAAMWRRKGGR
ncbi:MAG: hypothetical protein ACRDSK_10145 [Actinophytocola sp.]|uniref:hypothetical protein n=1 Tax=Actinophytocola sp. TaxID=1872138 RepID=UPI003D6C6B7F